MADKVLSIEEQRKLLSLCMAFEKDWLNGDNRSAAEWLKSLDPHDESGTLDETIALAELTLIESELRETHDARIAKGEHDLLEITAEQPSASLSSQPTDARYKFLHEIARGGAGAVWHVFDTHLKRFSAIKLLLEAQDSDEMRLRLEREARICASLQHPGIVPIHELSLLADGRPFINMKMIDGKTLDAILTDTNQTSRKKLLHIFRHICEAVSYAHTQGVVHRDLKPSNVMVGAFGEVQIMDWGLSKVLHKSGEDDWPCSALVDEPSNDTQSSNTIVGSVFGTPAYMSPEQARGDLELVDKRTDVFALGGVLCKILTGSPIYSCSCAAELRELARNGATGSAISRIRKTRVGKSLKSLAIACIEIAPNNRPADARAIVSTLDRIATLELWRYRISFVLLALALGFVCFSLFELMVYLSIEATIVDADGTVIK